ncbi:MAG: sigma-54 dependent transcriptional regulator [Melioribacteraceae bacterium]|nr:sigma-54 dependent transcriptional regulator [Melioribacteraceae bacterium]
MDDDETLLESLKFYLREFGHIVKTACDGESGVELVKQEHPDIVLCDIRLPNKDGIQVLEEIKEFDPYIQVILMTAYDDIQSTIKAMQKGAFDYIHKPLDYSQLRVRIKKASEIQELSQRLSDQVSTAKDNYQIDTGLIGNTPPMREIYKYIGQLSINKVTVLLQGESGTGKELVAKVIHYSGITKDHPFVAVNCTALPENLLESELFGHVKGAFTGAIKDKRGKFELAGKGTIFLDEISEMSPSMQAKLLRVLQEKEFEKVGGEKSHSVNARILAATNKELETLVRQGKFREDLFYRLKVFTIELPPLRERVEDIPLLAVHFLEKANFELHKKVRKIPFSVMEKLQQKNWEGNVRQLENMIKQAVVLCKSDVLDEEALTLSLDNSFAEISKNLRSLKDVEKDHIKLVLDSVNWDKTKAAETLGVSKPTLYSKIKTYQLNNH